MSTVRAAQAASWSVDTLRGSLAKLREEMARGVGAPAPAPPGRASGAAPASLPSGQNLEAALLDAERRQQLNQFIRAVAARVNGR